MSSSSRPFTSSVFQEGICRAEAGSYWKLFSRACVLKLSCVFHPAVADQVETIRIYYMQRPPRNRYSIDLATQYITNSHKITYDGRLKNVAKGLARTYIPTTSQDFPLSMLFKPLLPSNGTAPWKRHSTARPRLRRRLSDVAAAYRPPCRLYSKILISLLYYQYSHTPCMLPTATKSMIFFFHLSNVRHLKSEELRPTALKNMNLFKILYFIIRVLPYAFSTMLLLWSK